MYFYGSDYMIPVSRDEILSCFPEILAVLGGDYMIPVSRDEILFRFAGIRAIL